MSNTNPSTKQLNINTILLTIVLGIHGFLGIKVFTACEDISGLKVTNTAVALTLQRMDSKLNNSVSRDEFEQKRRDDLIRISNIETRLREIDIEIAKFRVTSVH